MDVHLGRVAVEKKVEKIRVSEPWFLSMYVVSYGHRSIIMCLTAEVVKKKTSLE